MLKKLEKNKKKLEKKNEKYWFNFEIKKILLFGQFLVDFWSIFDPFFDPPFLSRFLVGF